MRHILALLLLAGATVATAADTPAATPLKGDWYVHINIADHEADLTCSFAQSGNDLTGDCASDATGSQKLVGKVDDTKVTWQTGGGQVTLTFTGKLSQTSDKVGFIAGSVVVEEYGVSGEFTATQAK